MDYEETVNESIANRELKRFTNVLEKHVSDTTDVLNCLGPKAIYNWSGQNDCIRYELESWENASTEVIVNSSHPLVDKVILSLCNICKHLQMLVTEAEMELYTPLLTYKLSVKLMKSKESHTCFSQIIPHLHRIKCFIDQLLRVCSNAFLQLNALHIKNPKPCISVGSAHFQVVYEHLGRALSTLIIFDEIFRNSRVLLSHWSAYRKLVRSIQTESGKFHIEANNLVNLVKMIKDLEVSLMHGNIYKVRESSYYFSYMTLLFDQCVIDNKNFHSPTVQIYHFLLSFAKNKDIIAKNSTLRQETLMVTLGWFSQVENSINDGWTDYKVTGLALTALSIFYCQFFNVQDKKLFRSLVSLYKKVPCISICDSFVFEGHEYLKKQFNHLYNVIPKKDVESLISHQTGVIQQKISNISFEHKNFLSQVNLWMVDVATISRKCPSLVTRQDLIQGASVILQGLTVAYNLKYAIECILWLQTPQKFTRTCALIVCRMLELLKSIQCAFHVYTSTIVELLPHLRQYLSYQILSLMKATKERNLKERKSSKLASEILAASTIAENVLWGGGTKERQLIARVSLSLTNQDKWFTDEDFVSLLSLLKRIALSNDLQKHINEATFTPFVHLHPFLLPTYLEDFIQSVDNTERLSLMLSSVKDRLRFLTCSSGYNINSIIQQETADIEETIKIYLLQPICEAVEDELRLSSNRHLPARDPFNSLHKSLYHLVHMSPIKLVGTINVKDYIEQYLQRVFYNLTIVAPQDCVVYDLMRNIGYSMYGLNIVESHLPSQTVEQVVDILETVRNIHIFVQKYHYNMNQQFFVEAESKQKYLNVITIQDISNSIHTHGCGIVNTTVNFTYQFLRKKINILSEFFFDELIKAPLIKSLKHWREVKDSSKCFPYDKAEKFNRGIRKLGVSSDGKSYLDQFRHLVTQIGNSIGFVRLVRSGALHSSSGITHFIPNQGDISFVELTKQLNLSNETKRSISIFDDIISDAGSLQLDTDYLKIMVDAFAPAVRSDKMNHLRNFYVILPALTINFVENSVACNENLKKKVKSGTTFTQDGFAMGVSYILSILNQNDIFDSLHWWDSVDEKFEAEKKKVEAQLQGKLTDTKLVQTLSLSLSRLQQYEHQFKCLFLGIRSAKVFFNKPEILNCQ